jgi:hypothetical protein
MSNGLQRNGDVADDVQHLYTFQTDEQAWYVVCRLCRAEFELIRSEFSPLAVAQLLEHAHFGCERFGELYT